MTNNKQLLNLAYSVSQFSTCGRYKVGAVIVHENQLYVGYNSVSYGRETCKSLFMRGVVDRKNHREWSRANEFHAEINALPDEDITGSTVFCTHSPCFRCAESLLERGIVRLVYGKEYRENGAGMLIKAGIEVIHLPDYLQ